MIRGYQVSFSVKTSQKSAFYDLKQSIYFFCATTKNFKDKNILTYFGGSHLRARAAMAEWLNAPLLKNLRPGFSHRFDCTNIHRWAQVR